MDKFCPGQFGNKHHETKPERIGWERCVYCGQEERSENVRSADQHPPPNHIVIAEVEGKGWCPAIWDGWLWSRLMADDESGRDILSPSHVLGWMYVSAFIEENKYC